MEKRKPVCFLGGTCNDSNWREQLIPLLEIDYFNPVVKNWTPECMEEEIKQRETCDFVLYVITPEMTGVYSIAEVIDDSNKRPYKTIFCYLDYFVGIDTVYRSFDRHQQMSLGAVGKMVVKNGGKWCENLKDIADFLNNQ